MCEILLQSLVNTYILSGSIQEKGGQKKIGPTNKKIVTEDQLINQ
jgi:hypothetical protein